MIWILLGTSLIVMIATGLYLASTADWYDDDNW